MPSTYSAQLDGRIDWYGTYAGLVAQHGAGSTPQGTVANTTDKGMCLFTATGWQPLMST